MANNTSKTVKKVPAKSAPIKSVKPDAVVAPEVAKISAAVSKEPIAKPVIVAAPVVETVAVIEPKIVEPAAPVIKAEKLFVPETPKPKLQPTPQLKGSNTMNDTVKQVQETAQKFAADATAKVESVIGDVSSKTKAAFEKTTKLAEDAVAFQKDNMDAVVASSKLAAAGAEKAASHVAELGRKNFEDASAALKTFAGAKTPAEFFTLQNDFVKSSYEAMVSETSKSSEATLKFFGEMFQPLSSRMTVAAEKIKSATAL